MRLTLTATALQPDGEISTVHTCDGADASPALSWDGAPPKTRTFALIVDDPDAPAGDWVHWVVFNIPAGAHGLAGGVTHGSELPSGGRQGRNDFGKIGYGGPCPPPGPAHRYHWKVYALDTELDLRAGATKANVQTAMQHHILAHAEVVAPYRRRRAAR